MQRVKGTVVIKPKKIIDADEVLTPEQKATIDARLSEGLQDLQEGRVYGPFDSVDAMVLSLHGTKAPRKRQSSKHA